MMNNSVQQIFQALQNGANPNQIISHLIQQNPAFRQAMQAVNGKTPDQIRDMAYQMAQQRGVDLAKFAQQMGIPLPR